MRQSLAPFSGLEPSNLAQSSADFITITPGCNFWHTQPFAHDVLARSAEGERTIVAMIDQSKVNDAHQMTMVSLRVGRVRRHLRSVIPATVVSGSSTSLVLARELPGDNVSLMQTFLPLIALGFALAGAAIVITSLPPA